MKCVSNIIVSICLMVSTGSFLSAADAPSPTPPADETGPTDVLRPLRLALLVGVGQYAHLSEDLDGCKNDVVAMQNLLRNRFGFSETEIVTLLDDQATGSAIRTAMKRLADQVSTARSSQSPVVVFHFSGHGSQIPDQEAGDPNRDEADGLDETLVPHDASRQGGEEDIRDDELYAFVDEICSHGARVWVILDCCHSGTGARGTTKIRQLHRGLINTTPDEEPEEVKDIQPRRLPEGAVFLSACQANEVEPEYREGDATYGLLTRFLVEVLNEQPEVSQLSYDLLRESIVARYRSCRSVVQAPTPTLEFGHPSILRESVVHGTGIDRRPLWPVALDASGSDRLRISAGALHGVTKGSLFEVYSSPDEVIWEADEKAAQNGPSLVWLEVDSVDGATAIGKAFRWDGDERVPVSLNSQFRQGFAVERFHEHGDPLLRVQVVQLNDAGDPAAVLTPETAPQPIRDVLDAPAHEAESRWLTWTTAGDVPDVIIKIAAAQAAIFPSTGVSHITPPGGEKLSGSIQNPLIGAWGPVDLSSPDSVPQLRDLLRRIVRARNLMAVAARGTSTISNENQSDAPVRVDLELMRVDSIRDDGQVGSLSPWTTSDKDGVRTSELVMHNEDLFTFRVTNRDPHQKPVYITILHIDSNMGIDQIHPWQPEAGAAPEGQQKLAPGESLIVPGYFICNGEPDEPPIYGERTAVVLATRVPNRFHLLAQEGLPVTRNSGSPLEQLLMEQTEFRTRGGIARRQRRQNNYDSSWGADIVQWKVQP